MRIGVVAKLKVKPGKGADIERIFHEMAREARAKEPGNLFYSMHKSRADADLYVVLEQYADQAALDAHSNSEHVKRFGPQLGALLAGAPEIEFFDAI
jgi:quinol monooxygenase YgiN